MMKSNLNENKKLIQKFIENDYGNSSERKIF